MKKVKKIDNFTDRFSSLEHMIVRLEDKIQENRYQIEDLKNRLLWGNIVIVVLIGIVIFELVR
jgi:chaperonin cofactor prefoldin